MLGARRAERIDALAKELTDKGGRALATEVTGRAQVKALVDRAVAAYGRIDVRRNNAGLMPLAPRERLKVDEWEQMVDVNIKGVLYGIAAALPHMREQKSGPTINVSSVTRLRRGRPSIAARSSPGRALATRWPLEADYVCVTFDYMEISLPNMRRAAWHKAGRASLSRCQQHPEQRRDMNKKRIGAGRV